MESTFLESNIFEQAISSMKNQVVVEKSPLHPAVQILIWSCSVLVVQKLSAYSLIFFSVILIFLAVRICWLRFYTLLLRIKWILLALFLIYAYAGQGTVMWMTLGVISPLRDGMLDGFEQILRLVSVLAGLSILLTILSRLQLISGIYSLSRPLSLLGVNRDRFAVRLALTLRYVESKVSINGKNWIERIKLMLQPIPQGADLIELSYARISLQEWTLLIVVLAVTLGMWL